MSGGYYYSKSVVHNISVKCTALLSCSASLVLSIWEYENFDAFT